MTATTNLASEAATSADLAGASTDPTAESGPFVLNLCSSTTPMALAQTDLPELQRFTFFVSRRFEEGRERFRLHMGFFATLAEAEEWLGLVREIYPGAWAGEAPGKKLRARAVEAAATQASHAVGPQPTRPVSPARPPVLAAAARALAPPTRAAARPPMVVPTVHPPKAEPVRPSSNAAPVAASARLAAPSRSGSAAAAPPGESAPSRVAVGSPGTLAHAPRAAQPQTGHAAPVSARIAQRAPTLSRAPATPTAGASPRAHPVAAPARRQLFSDSNLKEVLAALDGPEHAARVPPEQATRKMSAPPQKGAGERDLTDTQVLRLLESRREERAPAVERGAGVSPADSSISLLKPDDTGTRRALRVAVTQNRPVSFAVQLLWSVQPVALDKVPPLAIFSAYTLYCVEGSRGGRKWYGLRLGFFNDAISAKQVAYYVRSEFASVAVIPVGALERERATADSQRVSGAPPARRPQRREDSEIKLIEDSGMRTPSVPAAASKPAPLAARGTRKPAGTVAARARRTPQTLEETLEILGANELAIDRGTEIVNDSGVRHLRVEVQKNTPFSRLLERLSERVKKP